MLTAALAVGGLSATAPAVAISGGVPAAEGSYGFVAKISMIGRACSGALVDPQWVITAASCFPENPQGGTPAKDTTVTVGRTNLTGTAGHVAKVTGLVARSDRNVMLAKLDTLINDVTPIALGSKPAAIGEPLRVAGYGRTATDWVPDVLRTGMFTVTSSTATTLTLTGDNGADTCKGDAGGPAFREANGRTELVAINSTSWQHGCLVVSETRQGSTEARVDDIASWIRQQIPDEVTSGFNATEGTQSMVVRTQLHFFGVSATGTLRTGGNSVTGRRRWRTGCPARLAGPPFCSMVNTSMRGYVMPPVPFSTPRGTLSTGCSMIRGAPD